MTKLELYFPLRPFSVTQQFGESQACYNPLTRQVTQRINGTCQPSFYPLYPFLGLKGHTGLDIRASDAQNLYHCAPAGTVEEIETEPNRGLGIGIVTDEQFDFGEPYGIHYAKVRYWHLKGFEVQKGEHISTSQLIGYCDNTGLSAGTHLHFEVKPVDKTDGGITNAFQTNGYAGAINPTPYFNDFFAKDQPLVVRLFTSLIDAYRQLIEKLKGRSPS